MPLTGEENLITAADLPLLGVVEEFISDVATTATDAERGAAIDEVLSALGKRAKRPVTSVDSALKRAMVWKTVWFAILHRGFSDGDREKIEPHIAAIDAWLDLVALGKREPQFTDSSPSVHEMGPLAGSTRRSDIRLVGRCGPGGYGPKFRCGCD